jgi:hypothetical protein
LRRGQSAISWATQFDARARGWSLELVANRTEFQRFGAAAAQSLKLPARASGHLRVAAPQSPTRATAAVRACCACNRSLSLLSASSPRLSGRCDRLP